MEKKNILVDFELLRVDDKVYTYSEIETALRHYEKHKIRSRYYRRKKTAKGKETLNTNK